MKKYWLAIEPYSYIKYDENNSIFYNPINKELISIESPEIREICKRLTDNEPNRVISVNKKFLNNPITQNFISDIRKHFIGDVLESYNSKPVSIQTKLGISSMPNEVNFENIDFSDKVRLWEQIREISIFINSSQSNLSKNYNNFYKQNLSIYNSDQNLEITIDKFKKLINKFARYNNLYTIKYIGW